MSQKKFLFDSDSLITAKNLHYSPNFCPAFWDWIISGNKHSIFFTIDRVADEMKNGKEDDYLRKFFELHQDSLVIKTKKDHKCLAKYAEIQQWANAVWAKAKGKSASKTAKALEIFAKEQTADPWLVAYASVYGFVIVSNEASAFASQTSVKLPDVANAFEVKVIKLHELLHSHSENNFSFKMPRKN